LFKPRGVFNRILSREVGPAGVVAASGGNAGLAVAYAARELGYRAEVFLPTTAPAVKVARLREYGAVVHQVGEIYAEALVASNRHADETGALVIHAYDQPEVVAGQGTIARELDGQLTGVDTVLVAVGGGGLIGGIAAWYSGRVKVVAVEAEGSPTFAAAVAAGDPVDIEAAGVAADSLGARRVGVIAWHQYERGHIAGSIVVAGDAVLEARQRLWSEARIAAEPGGAAAVAALTTGAYEPRVGEVVVAIVCGANTSMIDLT
jgi:threonine dehydratase